MNIAFVNLFVGHESTQQIHKCIVYDQLYVQVCMCMYAEARGRHQVSYSITLPQFLETKSLTEPGARPAANKPPAPLLNTELGLQACDWSYSALYVDAVDLNSSLYACTASDFAH